MAKKGVRMAMKAMIVEILSTAVLLLTLAFLVLQMEWGDAQIALGVKFVYGIACLLGGIAAGMTVHTRKYLSGGCCGLLYFFVWWMLVMIAGGTAVTEYARTGGICAICILSGMMGGMLSALLTHE